MAGFLRLSRFFGRQFGNSYLPKYSRCSTLSQEVFRKNVETKHDPSETSDDKIFTSVFPHVAKTLAYEEDPRLSGVMLHFKELLEYNVPHGKRNRGIATVVTFKMLNSHQTIASEQLYLASIMGWCIELVILKTAYGQSIDLACSGNKTSTRFDMFTPENYATITEYKTSYYSFYLPVAAALHMSGITDPNTHAQAREVLVQIGHYFQVQDDYLDCFGNSSLTGKIGTDIQEGKCTWLIVNAVRKADTRQLQLLKDNYGREEIECVQQIKKLYQDLQLPQLYDTYEQDMQTHFNEVIKKDSLKLPISIFEYCLKQIYQRKS